MTAQTSDSGNSTRRTERTSAMAAPDRAVGTADPWTNVRGAGSRGFDPPRVGSPVLAAKLAPRSRPHDAPAHTARRTPGPPGRTGGADRPRAAARATVAAPPRRRGRSPRRERRTRNVAAAMILAAFLGLELAVILTVANGPTLDEGIYVTAGRRTLEGSGGTDGYLGWFAGSLLWPALAGDGRRASAASRGRAWWRRSWSPIALVGVWRAAATLFGSRAGPVHRRAGGRRPARCWRSGIWRSSTRRPRRGSASRCGRWPSCGAATTGGGSWRARRAYAFAVLGKYPVAVVRRPARCSCSSPCAAGARRWTSRSSRRSWRPSWARTS